MDTKKTSNILAVAAALCLLVTTFDARAGLALSVATLIGIAVYFRLTKWGQ